MAGWTEHTGLAVALPFDNIDTDQLIPARFMSVPRSEGYGSYLLHDVRRDGDGALLEEFPLNRCDGASVLVAGRNFGSGSSREAAAYALVDAGIRVVIAPSFGDIFAGNAVNNGLLPARAETEDLLAQMDQNGSPIAVSLTAREIRCGAVVLPFELDDTWRQKLVNGWDDIDLTLQHADEISAFRADRRSAAPWSWPQGSAD